MEAEKSVHVWEMCEISLRAQSEYPNPYLDVDVWIDLEGPGFSQRVYGFWNGGAEFLVRFTASAPGRWTYSSGSNTDDPGLNRTSGSVSAVAWTDEEVAANECRRGFIRPTGNGHAFEYADGTPFFYLADTWWATATSRYPWYEDSTERTLGPDMGFKDMVAYRKSQGFNGIAMITGFPNWDEDGYPSTFTLDDEERTFVRAAWQNDGTCASEMFPPRPAKRMSNSGGRPFLFPGKVAGYEGIIPDYERVNPAYFEELDKKVAYLNSTGMIPFIEVARRDATPVWRRYYSWPDSYVRFIHYVFCRYGAFNTLLSPIHYDYAGNALTSEEMNRPANLVIERYGRPPFGNPVSANAAPSTLLNFGGPDRAKWISFHQIGNWREHDHFWHLTEIYRDDQPLPAVNGEPYYPGFPDDDPPAESEAAGYNCRSGMYGGFLSGAFAGYIYGADGMWGGNVEDDSKYKIWDALQFETGDQVRHLFDFAMSIGDEYANLVPDPELLSPNKSGDPDGYRGWAFCAHTSDKRSVLCYFEKESPPAIVRSIRPDSRYSCRWFDPRTGQWLQDSGDLTIQTDPVGRATLPDRPDERDWALLIQSAD